MIPKCPANHGPSFWAMRVKRRELKIRWNNWFFELHWAEGTIPGGGHFELRGDDVTECNGGARQLADEQLGRNYLSTCDSRLNAGQFLELSVFRLRR